MRSQQARKKLLSEYLSSLAIASAISIAVSPMVSRGWNVNPFISVPVSAFLFGTAFFLLGTVRSRIRLRSFLLNLAAQTALMAATVAGSFYVLILFSVANDPRTKNESASLFEITNFVISSEPVFIWIFLGGFAMAVVINFALMINEKMGPGILLSWVTGKYHTPREQELVFMFVDMKDSTTLAEKLGAIKFSGLVRDFFHDMTLPLIGSRGRVSHYIGDEAVIYWKPKHAFSKKGCIAFFKWYEADIAARASYYQSTYGVVPEFKGGMHIGPVVATEVGEIKSEIVFHGDVLNTTARIQGMCNETGAKLLCSQTLASKLQLPEGALMSALGPVRLKGKAEELELVAIE